MYGWLVGKFRRKRMMQFLAICRVTPHTRILDVGGYPGTWRGLPIQANVLLLNRKVPCFPSMPSAKRDALALPFSDKSFDLVFCNSVIEHVCTAENQYQMARESEALESDAMFRRPISRSRSSRTLGVRAFSSWSYEPVAILFPEARSHYIAQLFFLKPLDGPRSPAYCHIRPRTLNSLRVVPFHFTISTVEVGYDDYARREKKLACWSAVQDFASAVARKRASFGRASAHWRADGL